MVETVKAEQSLNMLVETPDTGQGRDVKPFPDNAFNDIADLLRQLGKDSWSRLPRTYAVLRMVNQLDVMDDFVALGVKDFWFPYSEKSLPQALKSPAARQAFLQLQACVQSISFDLERGADGSHRYFADPEALPFHIERVLGKGGFATVFAIESELSKRTFALKRFSRGRTFKESRELLDGFERELAVLKRLSHRHVVELVGSYTDPRHVGLLMSPVADQNLESFMCEGPLTKARASRLCKFYGCTAIALRYLHEHRIRHKDIKPQNILVHGKNVLLTDFGLARDASAEQVQTTTEGRPSGLTRQYASPELADWDHRSYSSDIWSLGCVFLEMATVLHNKSVGELRLFMETHGSYKVPYWTNQKAIWLWMSCLKRDAGHEPTKTELGWIFSMLQMDRMHRVTAGALVDCITEHETNSSFCGSCCVGDDSSASNDSPSSERETSDAVDPFDDTDYTEGTASTEEDPPSTSIQEIEAKMIQLDTKDYWPLPQHSTHGTVATDPVNEKEDQAAVTLLLESVAEQNQHEARLALGGYGNIDHSWAGGAKGLPPLPPLHWAAEQGHEYLVGMLLIKGANIDARAGRFDCTALHFALVNKQKAVIQMLLDKGANTEVAAFGQRTPLHYACVEGYKVGVQLLLNGHAHMEACAGKEKKRPLHFAAENGNDSVARLLLEHGADLDARDEDDKKAAWYARKGGYEDVLRLLTEGRERWYGSEGP